jgi:hypothetical protein
MLKMSMEYWCKITDRRKTKVNGGKRVLAQLNSPQNLPRILDEIEVGPPHNTKVLRC